MDDVRIVHRRSEPASSVPGVEAEEYQFHFLAGRPCLDLVATIGERWHRGFERLRTPDDLARWIEQSGMVAAVPPVAAKDLDRVRALRGAIARVVMAWGLGEDLPAADLDVVNDAAARPDPVPVLRPDAAPTPPHAPTVAAVAAALARDATDLVVTADPTRLRECAAEDCSLLFHDASRPGSRRWCSMAGCGNRHKTSRYRRRHAAAR